MITKIEGVCQFTGCDKPAQFIAGHHGTWDSKAGDYVGKHAGCYCEKHAHAIADSGLPEYIDDCPNCGCRHGVN
jgi:hypothetical protein